MRRAKPEKPAQAPAELAGTAWEMKMNKGVAATTFHFLPGGVLRLRVVGGGWEKYACTWEQSGAEVVFSVDRGYATYRGQLRGGRLRGEASNVNGLRWKFVGTYAGPAEAPKARPRRASRAPGAKSRQR